MKEALIIANTSGLITRFLKNDIEILINKGYKIECACNTNHPDFNTDLFFEKYGINVHHVDLPVRNLDLNLILKSYRMMKKIFKQKTYELIHCCSNISSMCETLWKRYYKNCVYFSWISVLQGKRWN